MFAYVIAHSNVVENLENLFAQKDILLDSCVPLDDFNRHETIVVGRKGALKIIVWERNNASHVSSLSPFNVKIGWGMSEIHSELHSKFQIELDSEGCGGIKRSSTWLNSINKIVCGNDTVVYSNRAALCSVLRYGDDKIRLNQKFIAQCLGTGWPLGSESLVEGVSIVPKSASIKFDHGQITETDVQQDIWENSDLVGRFESNNSQFWDFVTEKLKDATSVFFGNDGKPLLNRFSLSGGKDSRLLLGLLNTHDSFKDIPLYTAGAPYSPDVVTASHIAERFSREHYVSDNVFSRIDAKKLFHNHLFLSEGRTAPTDFTVSPGRYSRTPVSYGHELGLRESENMPDLSSKSLDDIWKYTLSEFQNFDVNGFLKEEVRYQNISSNFECMRQIFDTTTLKDNVFWRFFVENRTAHYVSHVQEKDEWAAPSPYLLMNDFASKVAYAIGSNARKGEFFHFEVLRRVDEWLAYDCPFGDVEWSKSVKKISATHSRSLPIPFPQFVSPMAPAKGTYSALELNRDVFKSFVLDNISSVDDFVDSGAVEAALERPWWTQAQMGSLFYLTQLCEIEGASWTDLKPNSKNGRELSFPISSFGPSEQEKLAEYAAVAENYRQTIPSAITNLSRACQSQVILRRAFDSRDDGDLVEASHHYAAAAILGNADAQSMLGRAYLYGEGVKKDVKRGIKYLEQAQNSGAKSSAGILGEVYKNGGAEVPKNLEKSLRYLNMAVNSGDEWALIKRAEVKEELDLDASSDWISAKDFLRRDGLASSNAYAALILARIAVEEKTADPLPEDIDSLFTLAEGAGVDRVKSLRDKLRKSI